MATRIACASTNWTTSTTWATVDGTSFSNSESANTALTTSYVESSTFTPGAITVDGIAVKIASRAASPTGTMSIHLAIAGVEVVGSAVTVNVSDVPTCVATSGTTTPVDTAEGGWFFLKFSSPLLLLGATLYSVGGKTSSATQVNLWSASGSNWSRALRTTTTANMAAGDDAIITGEWTAAATVTARSVTMDETATTDYGGASTSQVSPSLAITNNGTLTWGTTASTNYILRQSGLIVVYNGGSYKQGASGAEIPRNSTATLQMDCASDGDFGIVARKGSTVNMFGLSRTSGKNFSQTKLTANAAAAATSITIADDTGWLSGDVVCLAPTTNSASLYESKALTGNATATTAAISALTNAHSGTTLTQAEVGLLTRNNVMKGVTANVTTFLYGGSTATVALSWTEYRYMGTAVGGKVGLTPSTTTGTFTADYCSVYDCDCMCIQINGASGSGVSFTNCIFYNFNLVNGSFNTVQATSGTWIISNCMFCGSFNSTGSPAVTLADVGGTFTNNSISGANGGSGTGLQMAEQAAIGTFTGLNIHSNNQFGIGWTNAASGSIGASVWHNNNHGSGNAPNINGTTLTFLNCNFYGNNGVGVALAANFNPIFDTCTFNSTTTITQTGLSTPSGATGFVYMFNCTFSAVSGVLTKCNIDINFGNLAAAPRFICDKTSFNGTTIFSGVTSLADFPPGQPLITVQNYNAISNDNRSYYPNVTSTLGVIQSNSTTVYSPNALSEQMTPASATVKLVSQSIFVECTSGKAATPIVQVQKNGTYNGNAPRLIVKRQDSIGVTADTVLQTFSAGANTWQGLTGTTVVATQNGVFEFVVDCDGTAGSVFVGDATASTA